MILDVLSAAENAFSFWESMYQFFTRNDIGSIASSLGLFVSILGVAISVYIGITVAEIRRRVRLRHRAEHNLKDLTECASKISALMTPTDFNANVTAIEREMLLALVTLKSLRDMVIGDTKKTITQTIRSIEVFKRSIFPKTLTQTAAWDVYSNLLQCAKSVEVLLADQREVP